MKTKDIVVGSTYLTYIGQTLSRVVVVSVVEGREDAFFSSGRRTRFRVRRQSESTSLPKPRSAAALRPLPTPHAKLFASPTTKELFPDLDPTPDE